MRLPKGTRGTRTPPAPGCGAGFPLACLAPLTRRRDDGDSLVVVHGTPSLDFQTSLSVDSLEMPYPDGSASATAARSPVASKRAHHSQAANAAAVSCCGGESATEASLVLNSVRAGHEQSSSSCCGGAPRASGFSVDGLPDDDRGVEAWPPRVVVNGVLQEGRCGLSEDTASEALLPRTSNASSGGSAGSTAVTAGGLDAGPLLNAVRRGRWLEARRALEGLEALGSGAPAAAASLDIATLERVRRIGARFDESLLELRCHGADSWKEHHDAEGGVDFAFRLAESTFQVVSSRVYEGFDAFQAFVALCEYDLCKEYNRQVVEAEMVTGAMPTDTIWRVLKQVHGSREDNIWQVSCVDALDEPLGALWFSTYTPLEEGLTELQGVQLPQPEGGAVRIGFWRAAYAVTPLWTAVPSFRMTFALCRRPSSAAYIFSNRVQREVGGILDSFGGFLHECRDLNWRAFSSPRAPFYDYVRQHLEEKLPKGSRAAPPVPLLRLTFAELSALLPEDWADHPDEDCFELSDSDAGPTWPPG